VLLVLRGRADSPAPAMAGAGAATGPAVAPGGPPAGWYADPQDPSGAPRYWDGASWSPPGV
jgi:hypothetical protein